MMKLSLVALLLFALTHTYAQDGETVGFYKFYKNELKEDFKTNGWWYKTWNRYDVNPGFSRYSVGYSKSKPLLGWDNVVDKGGVRYRLNHFDLGASFWSGNHKGDTATTDAMRIAAGYFTPISAFSIGRRYLDVRGALLQPAVAGGYAYSNKKHGIYLAPSMHLQLPFVVLEARANMEYTFGGGFNIFPELSLQLDALYTLLDPHKEKTGIWERYSTYALYDKTDIYGNVWYDVHSTYSRHDYVILDMGPLWGITPRMGFAPSLITDNPYKTYGVGLSGRINFLGADIHYDRGFTQIGVVPNVQALDGTVRGKFDNEKVSGLLPANHFSFQANANVYGLLLGIFKRQAIKNMGFAVTPLNRFNFHLGFTYSTVGTPTYNNEQEAIDYTNQFFNDHPEVERNAINDPLQHENEWGVTYGWSYEMGAVGVRVNHKLMKTSGKSSTLEVYYILPITKILKAY